LGSSYHLGPRTIVLVDKVYDADRIRELIQEQGASLTSRPGATGAGSPASARGSAASDGQITADNQKSVKPGRKKYISSVCQKSVFP
jgi:hypothetical protein